MASGVVVVVVMARLFDWIFFPPLDLEKFFNTNRKKMLGTLGGWPWDEKAKDDVIIHQPNTSL